MSLLVTATAGAWQTATPARILPCRFDKRATVGLCIRSQSGTGVAFLDMLEQPVRTQVRADHGDAGGTETG